MDVFPVLISISSTAHRDDVPEDETLSLIVSGRMELDETGVVIRYEEAVDETIPPQQVKVTIGEEAVSMERSGEYSTSMVFRMGCRFEGLYQTPMGDMDLALFCTRLDYDLGDDGGEVYISYQLDLNGTFAAVHEMEMRLIRQNDG